MKTFRLELKGNINDHNSTSKEDLKSSDRIEYSLTKESEDKEEEVKTPISKKSKKIFLKKRCQFSNLNDFSKESKNTTKVIVKINFQRLHP